MTLDLVVDGDCPEASATTRMWYRRPATRTNMLEHALPIGNGRLGALISNDPAHELLYISEQSHWQGGPNQELASDGQHPYEVENFGSLTQLAHLQIDIPPHVDVSDYTRELDLASGVATARYTHDGVAYVREAFASNPGDVIALRFHGDGSYTGSVSLTGSHGEGTTAADGVLSFTAQFPNKLQYAAAVTAASATGSISTEKAEDGSVKIAFVNCTDLTIVFNGCTNYAPDATAGWRSAVNRVSHSIAIVTAAALQPYAELLNTHVADFADQFSGMQLSLGQSTPTQRALDTWERVQRRGSTGEPDPELEALYVQFGRYLLISSSRHCGLPPGLQGPWLSDNTPAWMGDYHNDININMNYWLVDRCGLSRNFTPLADYVLSQLPSWTAQTQAKFNDARNRFRNSSGTVAGWAVSFSTNIYGGMGWWWHPAGNAWLCLNLWEHWEYTQDLAYLKRIYPAIRGACEFWETRLIAHTLEDGREVLVADKDWSPEHGPEDAVGITYAQELVHALFAQQITAAALLDTDTQYATTMAALQDRLHLPGLTATGRLQEWMSERDDLGEPQHRHLSALMGLFPGDRLRVDHSPATLLEGAARLLDDRGMESYGWSNAWRCACWARLKDAERAYALLGTNLAPSVNGSTGTAANLFDMYNGSKGEGDGLFQIDSNFGTPAAVLEMLVYSRPGVVELLPALPAAWGEGSITGAGARGGFVVDMIWTGGKVDKVTVRSVGGRKTTVVAAGREAREVELALGESVTIEY